MRSNEDYSGDRLLWYVSYGSNMVADRLRAYIEGIASPVFGPHPAARDKRAPILSRAYRIRHRLYFGGHSYFWKGAVAFLEPKPLVGWVTLGRAYLLRWSQVEDIVAHESSRRATLALSRVPDVGSALTLPVTGKYDLLLRLDDCDGIVAVTATTAQDIRRGTPKPEYLDYLERGLREIPEFTNGEITDYISQLRQEVRAPDGGPAR